VRARFPAYYHDDLYFLNPNLSLAGMQGNIVIVIAKDLCILFVDDVWCPSRSYNGAISHLVNLWQNCENEMITEFPEAPRPGISRFLRGVFAVSSLWKQRYFQIRLVVLRYNYLVQPTFSSAGTSAYAATTHTAT
jgi:hypothetical protein